MLTGPEPRRVEERPVLRVIEIAFAGVDRLKLIGPVEPSLAAAVTKAVVKR